ncbi:hypothetical protein HBI56_088860 [Parastagonospora nodorum]|uniref:Cell wall mannoprotein PIR1-like C-terminal domain-containing protein n=2 Tax=Phaeosphaeria nodorum (strain SN15 / ATCC MYA-4574 / FGSC 10173) TaxID=321614 RepID=A0A7U2I7S8_PHANO|nr:hypothetical protein SNOG_10135 [Parastagonospora nodorum SN15]KAH3913009.1 hypothetical protein HBH56_110600 [Parastagonospora nodorum]EAT82470.2 hypothetical protein SNOG_10135 [Parastagonospora nodorum SN15]KAH3925620.1 hypothetical protein HBH54_179740 [Parastagonospora nodorum]KAH3951119.1 hypothetical protein HBH53_066300 [Parastagonospora nodorum]KAH3974364.1 hypothetical protein HBH51_091940 [Parastagonospora nodorum]
MRTSTILAPLFLAATSIAQGVEEGIAPSQGPPSGCEPNANGNFTIGTLKVHHATEKRESASEAADGALVCNLEDGILRDRDGRTGSVVANRQFQFDGPPQAGAIYTGGFSICSNGSLAIGGSTRWWQCSSGGFYNLYDEWIGDQCEEIRIQVTFPQKPSPSASASTSSVTSTAVVSSLSVSVATVESSLATISGAVSTVSKSAVGPSASFASSNVSMTGSVTGSPSSTRSSSAGQTGAADAPPAGGAAAASFGIAKGSMLGAFIVIFGAALVL